MDIIIKNLKNENWNVIKQSILQNEIDWDYLVDQINGLAHLLVYKNKMDLIELIPYNQLQKIILKPNLEKDTVAHIAAKLKNNQLLSFFIKAFLKIIYQKNKSSFTPLYYVVTDISLIKQIVLLHQFHDHYISNTYTLVDYYVLKNNIEMVEFLLENLNKKKYTYQVYFTAIQSTLDLFSKTNLIKLFIQKNLNLNCLSKYFLTPLIASVYENTYSISKLLLENGANTDVGMETANPLILSIQKKDLSHINLLLNHNCSLTFKDKYLRTAGHYSFFPQNNLSLSIKKTVLTKTKNLNIVDINLQSILFYILENDSWNLYKDILQKKKLNIHLKNKNNVKVLDLVKVSELDDFLETVYQSYIFKLRNKNNWIDEIDNDFLTKLKKNQCTKSCKKIILHKILHVQSFPQQKSKNPIFKFICSPKSNFTNFSGNTHNYLCFLYYILQKYPIIKLPTKPLNQPKNKELYKNITASAKYSYIFKDIIKDYLNHSASLINHLIIWKNKYEYFISPYIVSAIRKTIKKYPRTVFILLKLTIVGENNFNHANILIFDIKNKFVERFDPYGNAVFIVETKLDQFLNCFFTLYFPQVKYVTPLQTTNGASFQIISDELNSENYVKNDPMGFCVAWCFFYVEMRIQNKEINPKTLIKKSINQIVKHNDKFKDHIRNYASYLDTEKNSILSKSKLSSKYWYAKSVPNLVYKSHLKYIRNMYKSII